MRAAISMDPRRSLVDNDSPAARSRDEATVDASGVKAGRPVVITRLIQSPSREPHLLPARPAVILRRRTRPRLSRGERYLGLRARGRDQSPSQPGRRPAAEGMRAADVQRCACKRRPATITSSPSTNGLLWSSNGACPSCVRSASLRRSSCRPASSVGRALSFWPGIDHWQGTEHEQELVRSTRGGVRALELVTGGRSGRTRTRTPTCPRLSRDALAESSRSRSVCARTRRGRPRVARVPVRGS